jgi:hypothetical protein
MSVEIEDGNLPDKCPLFPQFKVRSMGWIEARLVTEGDGEEEYTTIPKRYPPQIDEISISEELGAGKFYLTLKKRNNDFVTRRVFKCGGTPKDWAGTDTDDDDDAGSGGGTSNMPQMITALAAFANSIGGGAGGKSCPNCAMNIQQMQSVLNAATDTRRALTNEIDDMRRRHNDEIDRYKKDISRLEDDVRRLQGENAGWLKDKAQSASGVKDAMEHVKEMLPMVGPAIKGLKESLKEEAPKIVSDRIVHAVALTK